MNTQSTARMNWRALRIPSLAGRFSKIFRTMLLFVGLIFVGMLIAVMPAGFVIRLAALILLGVFMMLAWMLRSDRVGVPAFFGKLVLGATIIISILWPRYIFFSLGGPYVSPYTLSAVFGLMLSCFWIIYSPTTSRRVFGLLFEVRPFGWLLLAWFAWRFITCLSGDYPIESLLDFIRETLYLSSFILIGAVLLSVDGGGRILFRIIVLAGLAVCAIGLVEAFAQKNPFVKYASGADTKGVSDAIKTIAMEKIRAGAYRAQSVFEHPIVFSQFVAAAMPICIYTILHDRSKFWKFVSLLLIPIGLAAIVKSGSRAGLVSIAIAISFLIAMAWMRGMVSKGVGRIVSMAAMPFFVFGAFVAYIAIQQLVAGRNAVEASSTSTRAFMYQQGISALAENPIMGYGQGLAVVKAGVIGGEGTPTIDSYILTVAVDSGYVGILLLLLAMGFFSHAAIRAALADNSDRGSRIAFSTAAVLAVFATFAGLSIPSGLTLMWLLLFATLASMRKEVAW